MYKCPKCEAEFELGTKFCQSCGCNLELEFIETPTCPKCQKVFTTGVKFCDIDGSKLVSPDKLIPRCVKCEKEYPADTNFCLQCGGKVIPEALRKGIELKELNKSVELIGEQTSKVTSQVTSKVKELISKKSNLSKNKKHQIIGACVILIVLFFCILIIPSGGKGALKIKAKVVNGSNYDWRVATVRIEHSNGRSPLVTAKYKNGKFSVKLPPTMYNQYLESVTSSFQRSDNIRYSNEDAQVTLAFFQGYGKNNCTGRNGVSYDCESDRFILGNPKKGVMSTFVYSDRDVSITGTHNNLSVNIFLKKGWNRIFTTSTKVGDSYKISQTMKNPGGLKWYSDNDFYEESKSRGFIF